MSIIDQQIPKGISREYCSDAVRGVREILSHIVDVENALMQPKASLLSTFMNTIILSVVTLLGAILTFLPWIISQNFTTSFVASVCIGFTVFALHFWIQRPLKNFLSREESIVTQYREDLEVILKIYKELYEMYRNKVSTCYETLCRGDSMDTLCKELSTLRNSELTVRGSPQL